VATSLSLRRLWSMYKRLAIADRTGSSTRELIMAQGAFYSGARGVLKVLAHMLEQGEYEELHATIRRQGRQIERIRARRPRSRAARRRRTLR